MEHDPIRAKIIELIPEIVDRPSGFTATGRIASPEITLADVLRAIPIGVYMKSLGEQVRLSNDDDIGPIDVVYWNLSLDYDSQTPEVRSFIGTLIGVV